MKTIKATLSVRGMSNALNELRIYKNTLETKVMVFSRQLALLAAAEVQNTYKSSSIKVDAVALDDDRLGYSIIADGKAVGFLEFGAGFGSDGQHPLAPNAPFEVSKGSYSRENAREFEEKGYWYFGGRRYTFVIPRRGLYAGSEYIREHLREVIRRSFGDKG